MLRANGEVILAGDTVELTEQAGERLAARCLPVDDVDIGEVVDVEEHGLTCQQRGVGGCASNHRQGFGFYLESFPSAPARGDLAQLLPGHSYSGLYSPEEAELQPSRHR